MPVAKNFDREKWIKEQDKMIENFEKDIKDIAQNFKQSPEKIAEFLQFKSQFYNYSIRNTMLIQNQAPYSSVLASFEKWKERDANVLKGSKGIKIFVPVQTELYKLADDEKSHLVSKASEQIKQQIAQGKIASFTKTSFKLGNVFDIGQTDYPKENYPKLFDMGLQSKDHAYLYEDLKDYATKKGFPVVEKNVESVALRGSYNLDTNEITISDKLNDTERLSTLTHELGHAIMHNASEDKGDKSKSVIEFEADCFSILLQTKMGVELTDMRKAHLAEHFEKLDTEIDIMETLQTANKVFVDFNNGFEKETQKIFEQTKPSLSEQAQPEQAKPVQPKPIEDENISKNNGDRGINDTKIRLKVGELTLEEAQELMSNDNGNLNIGGARITKLPEGLEVKGNLNISFTRINELPNGLKVDGNLDISHTSIKELPNGLKVNGDLDISHTMISKLPEGLEVKGNLNIGDTKITEFSIEKLPEELFVGGIIIANPSTALQTFKESEKWYTKKEEWETEIAKRQQLPHSEKKQKQVAKSEQTQPVQAKPIELLIKTTPFEKEGSELKGFATLIINNSFCVKNIEIFKGNYDKFRVAMPMYQATQMTYRALVSTTTKEATDEINARILKEFENPTVKTIDKNLKPMENDIGVSMQLTSGEKAIKGIATITINETFVIKRACVVEGKNGLFVQMPSYKKADGEYENIVFPIEKTVREQLNKAILDKYNEVFEKENVKTMEEWEKDIDALKAEKMAAETEKAMEIQAEKSAENNER